MLTGLASILYLMIFWAPGKGLCCALLAGSWHVFKLVLRIITYSAVIFNSIAISNKKMCLSKLIQSSTARTWHCLLAGDHILVGEACNSLIFIKFSDWTSAKTTETVKSEICFIAFFWNAALKGILRGQYLIRFQSGPLQNAISG